MDLDDFSGASCGQAYPLLNSVNMALARPALPPPLLIPGPVLTYEELPAEEVYYIGRKSSKDKKVVCYLPSWSIYRKGDGKFVPEDLDPSLCTHVVYAFASLDPNSLTVAPFDPSADIDNGLFGRVSGLKKRGVSVLVGVGGWTDSTGDKFSRLVSSPEARTKFTKSLTGFMSRHGFTGVSLEWNHPVCWQSDCSKGPSTDKENYLKLVQEVRKELGSGPELGVALSGYREVLERGYDIPALTNTADLVTIATYDYHGPWETVTGHISPLKASPSDNITHYNVEKTLEWVLRSGARKEALLLGTPLYGQSFKLKTAGKAEVGSEAAGPGTAGPFTQQPGMLAYYEICTNVKQKSWRKEQTADGPYAHFKDQWVSFQDPASIMTRGELVKREGLGGLSLWTVDLDDFHNWCCEGEFPLVRAANAALGRDVSEPLKGCQKPPPPVTPSPPTTSSPNEEEEWGGENPWWPPQSTTSTTTRRTTTSTTTKRPTTSSSTPWWTTTSTTTKRPTTSSTTPWWTTTSTTRRTTTTGTTSTTQVSLPISEPELPNEVSQEPELPESCETGQYLPAAGDCTSYYRCILGELRKQKCAAGLHWNDKRKICDWPDDAKCSSGLGVEKPSSTTTSEKPTEWWTTEKTTSEKPTEWWTTEKTTRKPWWEGETTSTTTQASQPAQDQCSNGQYYPSPESCDKFLICVNGLAVQQSCAPGLHWNPDKNICDWAFSSKCSSTSKEGLVRESGGCHKGAFTVYPNNCNKYLHCQWDKYELRSCAPGLHWNQKKEICDWPENAQCKRKVVDGVEEEEEEVITIATTSSKPITMNPSTSKPSSTTQWTWKPEQEWSWTSSTTTEEPWPETPYQHPNSGDFKVVCYFTNWAWYRQGNGKYLPEDINSDLCTHIVYGFAVLDSENLVIKPHDSWADFDNNFYRRVVWFRRKGVKVTLALGGWNDSLGDKYSRLVNNPSARRRFIEHAVPFLKKWKFDGLDLDWEYPKCWQTDCKKGKDSDKAEFGHFVRELRAEFDKHDLLLSSAVSPSMKIVDEGYDVKALADSLDWIAVMCYDYHGQWDKKTGHHSPMYEMPDDEFSYFNTNFTINYWISKGAPRKKIVVGMPLYGQGFTLKDGSEHGLNSPAPRPAEAGQYTRAAGFLAYYEICEKIKRDGWTVVKDKEGRIGPYAYKGDQWVGFDDQEMLTYKSNWIREQGLGGGMVWALDLDDFRGSCGQGKHPLLSTIAAVLAKPASDSGNSVGRPLKPNTTRKPVSGAGSTTTRRSGSGSKGEPAASTTLPTTTTQPTTQPTSPQVEVSSSSESTSVSLATSPSTTRATTGRPTLGQQYKVVCYFTNWAWYRQDKAKYLPEDIDADLCTHIVYGFAVLDPTSLLIKPHDSWADLDNKFYERVAALRSKGVKVTLALGGWNDSQGDKYSRLVNNPSARSKFTEHVTKFVLEHGFDGLDLDWEYPKCWQVDCTKGPASDKEAFLALVRELRQAFTPHGLLLSAAVSPAKTVIDAGYDVKGLSEALDWIAVMCYDYHGQWDKKTGHVAPMYPHPEDYDVTFNANFSIHYWMSQGADRSKLVMGMPLYGQSFSLAEASNNSLNAPTYGGGEAGDGTRARGFLAYYEICERVKTRGWRMVEDDTGAMGPYAVHGDQWVSFDDAATLQKKARLVKDLGLAGAMVWALDLDDFRNVCGCEEYPLLKTINREVRGYPSGPLCQLTGPPGVRRAKTDRQPSNKIR